LENKPSRKEPDAVSGDSVSNPGKGMRHYDFDFSDEARERRAEERAEFPRKRRPAGCRDRMCGATDCPNCFPSSWDQEKDEPEEEGGEEPEEE